MDQPHYDELLSAYLDRELSPDERATVDRLLEKSDEARARLRELEITSRFLRTVPQQRLEADFANSVMDRLRGESLLRPEPVQPIQPRRRATLWMGGPLAAAAVLLLAVWISRSGQDREQLDFHPDRISDSVPSALGLGQAPGSLAAGDLDSSLRQLEPGDIFGVIDEDGVPQFNLMVLDKPTSPDSIVCILLEQSQIEAGKAETGPPDPDAARSKPAPMSIEADREQIAKLQTHIQQARDQKGDAYPVLDFDIVASGDFARVLSESVVLHEESGRPGTSLEREAPATARSAPELGLRVLDAAVARKEVLAKESKPGPIEPQANPATQTDKPRTDSRRNDELEGAKFRSIAKQPAAAASQESKSTDSASPSTALSNQANQAGVRQGRFRMNAVGTVRNADTVRDVNELAKLQENRLGARVLEKDKQATPRIEVLLHFRPEPDQTSPGGRN